MKKFWELEDIHKGQPLIVAGNGPSLEAAPPELIDKYPVMGCNSVYTKEYFAENPVDWYCIEGVGHLKTPEERGARIPYIKTVREAGGWSLINRRMIHHFQHLDAAYAIDYMDYRSQRFNNFQFDPFLIYGSGHCVTYAMLQFAYFLTSGPVLLIGMDHKFVGSDWHFYPDEKAPEFHTMEKENYQTFRQRVDPKFQEVASVYEVTKRELVNLTPDSEAYMFKGGSYADWI